MKSSLTCNLQQAEINMLTFDTLAHLLNFRGCELLIVDTEGFDVEMLRSMIDHCLLRGEEAWPYVIQFETQGLCDSPDVINVE